MTTARAPGLVAPLPGLRRLEGKRICLVSTVPYFLVNQLGGQAAFLRDAGMDVVLVSSNGPEVRGITPGPHLQYEVIPIPRSPRPVQDLVALLRLCRLFTGRRFDIIHSTTPKAGLLAALAGGMARTPIRLHTFTGQPWVTLSGPLRWGARLADRVIGRLNTRCYADSKGQADFLVAERILSSRKLAVIGAGSLAGVDLARFRPDRWTSSDRDGLRRDLSISASSKVLIFVGRISPDKGIEDLIHAFQRLVGAGYDTHLLLVGPQDQERGGTSSVNLQATRRSERIHHVGYSPCPEKFLAVADIFCLPSYREGFGTVVIEAAAMGVPTVGSAIYGLADAVVDGETGLLVPPRDRQALFAALKRLLDDPDELDRMGRAARRRCAELFDARVVNQRVAEEYVRLIAMKDGP